jgi:hypothetical protein
MEDSYPFLCLRSSRHPHGVISFRPLRHRVRCRNCPEGSRSGSQAGGLQRACELTGGSVQLGDLRSSGTAAHREAAKGQRTGWEFRGEPVLTAVPVSVRRHNPAWLVREIRLHTEEVTGSNPVSPTKAIGDSCPRRARRGSPSSFCASASPPRSGASPPTPPCLGLIAAVCCGVSGCSSPSGAAPGCSSLVGTASVVVRRGWTRGCGLAPLSGTASVVARRGRVRAVVGRRWLVPRFRLLVAVNPQMPDRHRCTRGLGRIFASSDAVM